MFYYRASLYRPPTPGPHFITVAHGLGWDYNTGAGGQARLLSGQSFGECPSSFIFNPELHLEVGRTLKIILN
jgi:hypothetical protein